MMVHTEEMHGTWTKQQVFTYVALFVLLTFRFPIADLVSNLAQLISAHPFSTWMESLRLIQNWTHYLYSSLSFVLVGIVLIVNRRDLKSLNIDGTFIALFITASCLTYFKYYFWPLGWTGPFVGITLFILYFKKEYRFAKRGPIADLILIIILIGFILRLWLIRDSLDIKYIMPLIHRSAPDIPFVLVEEVIFRGLLWKFLINLNWSEPRVVGLQAVLFWLSHAYYMIAHPISFWINIPIASLLLGIIVWHSKSISYSLFAHIFYNFI